jgi:hypothetical protein
MRKPTMPILTTKEFIEALQRGDIQPQVIVESDNVEALAPAGTLLCDFGGGTPKDALVELLRALGISTVDALVPKSPLTL